MAASGKAHGVTSDRKSDRSGELEEFREKMAKSLADLDESLQRSRESRERAAAALKIGSR
jgi:hypothetical protein